MPHSHREQARDGCVAGGFCFEGVHIRFCGNGGLGFRPYGGSLGRAPSNQGLLPLTFGLSTGQEDQKPKRGGLTADLTTTERRSPVGASLLAKNARTTRAFRQPASSLTSIASKLAPTEEQSKGSSAYTHAPHHSTGRALARLPLLILILIHPPPRQAERMNAGAKEPRALARGRTFGARPLVPLGRLPKGLAVRAKPSVAVTQKMDIYSVRQPSRASPLPQSNRVQR